MSSISKLLLASLLPLTLGAGPLQNAVVRAVLFYSPSCPHCHTVIRDHLPGMFERFGGPGRVYFDAGTPEAERAFFLVSNGELEILLVNAAQPEGNLLYRRSAEALAIPEERLGVPRLVIRDSVLVGSFEIPEYLPALIEEARTSGGVDWPRIDGLNQVLAQIPSAPPIASAERDEVERATESGEPVAVDEPAVTDTPSKSAADSVAAPAPVEEGVTSEAARPEEMTVERKPSSPHSEPDPPSATEGPALSDGEVGSSIAESAAPPGPASGPDPIAPTGDGGQGVSNLGVIAEVRPSMMDLYARDPLGNGLSVLVLLGMVASLIVMAPLYQSAPEPREPGALIPVVALLGMVVAVYLTYVESSGAQAVCGPVGDCNAVQSSEYATLFGVIPIGAIGLVGYVAILAAWLVSRADSSIADWGRLSLLAMAAVGVLFSIYLTFLEPFVIGATCAWCLTSAVAITLLMWLSARSGFAAWRRLTSSTG